MSAHLTDARIDLRGNVIAEGQISYPPDPSGHFPTVAHASLRLGIGVFNSVSLTMAEAIRDQETGFLMSRQIGPSVSLPIPLSEAILSVLRRAFVGRRRITLNSQEGYISFGQAEIGFDQMERRFPKRRTASEIRDREANRPPTFSQLLSRWSLTITSGPHGLSFELEARLFGEQPAAAWQRNHGNFWSEVNDGPLRINFHVDGVTKTVAFGGPLADGAQYGDDGESANPPNRNDSLSKLHLRNSVYGYDGNIIVKNASNKFSKLIFSFDILHITTANSIIVHKNGFFTANFSSESVGLKGLELSRIATLLGDRQPLRIDVSNGDIGHLDRGREEYPKEHPTYRYALQANYDFDLKPCGLIMDYRVLINDLKESPDGDHQAGWVKDVIVIPWEIIICRFPTLLRFQSQMTDTPASE